MSLWTPSGEHSVPPGGTPEPPSAGEPGPPPGPGPGDEQAAADMDRLRRELAEAPAEIVVANHCYGLFELAAVYLSQAPPLLDQAKLAIDAFGYLVDGLGDRLGGQQGALQEALAQVRMAFVQLSTAADRANGEGTATPG